MRNNQSEKEVYEKVYTALKAFFEKEDDLLDVNVNERSISHKLAEYLQDQFEDLKVDCEYNRHGRKPKKVYEHLAMETILPDDLKGRTVYPDIIVHERGHDNRNLLVIEIKKNGSSTDIKWDIEKLQEFTSSGFGYEIGLFLIFDVGNKCLSDIRCFHEGKEKKDTMWSSLKKLA